MFVNVPSNNGSVNEPDNYLRVRLRGELFNIENTPLAPENHASSFYSARERFLFRVRKQFNGHVSISIISN